MGRHREFDEEKALDAALNVFWQKGYEGTSLDDLTRATGVARPGLYSAFGNKESLFRRAVARYDATYMAFMTESLDELTSRDVVKRILEGCVRVHTLYPAARGCLGINGALACSDEVEPIREELVRRCKVTESALKRRLERAQLEGDLPKSADCAVLASYIMTMTQGLAVQAKGGTSRAALDAIVEHVLAGWPAPERRTRRS